MQSELKPDEATLWARERWAGVYERNGAPHRAERIRSGIEDEHDFIVLGADAYRAGHASANARRLASHSTSTTSL